MDNNHQENDSPVGKEPPEAQKPHETGFELRSVLVKLTLYFIVLLIVGTLACYYLLDVQTLAPAKRVMYSVLCGSICFFSCFFAVVVSYYWRKSYGMGQTDVLLATAIRTGIPLVGALVFFAILDNNILNGVLLTLAGYYILMFAFEVKLTLPRPTDTTSTAENRD